MGKTDPSFPEWLLTRAGLFVVAAMSGIAVGVIIAYPVFMADDLHGLDLWKAFGYYGVYLMGASAMASALRLPRPAR